MCQNVALCGNGLTNLPRYDLTSAAQHPSEFSMFISLHLASDMILIDFPIYLADFSIIKSKSRSIQSETDNTLMFPCL